jgi:hypothetical protein
MLDAFDVAAPGTINPWYCRSACRYDDDADNRKLLHRFSGLLFRPQNLALCPFALLPSRVTFLNVVPSRVARQNFWQFYGCSDPWVLPD